MLDGDPGTGKSFITIDLAARLTSGRTLPGSTESMSSSPVLVLNAEDDIRDTILPCAKQRGRTLANSTCLPCPALASTGCRVFPRTWNLCNGRFSRRRGVRHRGLDDGFLSARGECQQRSVFSPGVDAARRVAASTGACILFVRHLRKAGGASAIYRGLGSIGIMGAMRTGLMISRHPDDPDLRVLTLSKTNIGPPARSFGFRLEKREEDGQTYVNWTGALDLPADDLFGTSVPLRAGSRTARAGGRMVAQRFLPRDRDVHRKSSRRPATAGFADRTLNRIKDAIGIESRAVRKKGVTEWWWHDADSSGRRSGMRFVR